LAFGSYGKSTKYFFNLKRCEEDRDDENELQRKRVFKRVSENKRHPMVRLKFMSAIACAHIDMDKQL
jgi:hypothetical protein